MLTIANANLLAKFGTAEQIDTFVKPMLAGRFTGTMALSEPQAGSSLADITTRAEPQDDGTYRLFGSKMWISGAEHEMSENIVHLVLAKIPGGTARHQGHLAVHRAQVPRRRRRLDRRAQRRRDLAGSTTRWASAASPTPAELRRRRFSHGSRAVGYLVGEPHRGIVYMFHMMNEARLGVGMGAVALGYTGYLKSLQYARERPQGRPITSQGPRHAAGSDHRARRRQANAAGAEVLCRGRAGAGAVLRAAGRLAGQRRSPTRSATQPRLLLDILTPVAKSWPSQWCLEANSLAIQVHGGYGYTREYDVEQHYRDNRLNPIHEGTHGIQSLDLLGRKVTQRGGASLAALGAAIAAVGRPRQRGRRRGRRAGRRTSTPPGSGWSASPRRCSPPVTSRPRWPTARSTWRRSATSSSPGCGWSSSWPPTGTRGDFYDGKRQAARYFFRYELPRPLRSSICWQPGPHDAGDARRLVLTCADPLRIPD